MTSREQFEAWHSAKNGWLPRHYDFYWSGSYYEDEEFQVAWECWQASRAALVIELPAALDSDRGYVVDRDAVIETLEGIYGLKVAP